MMKQEKQFRIISILAIFSVLFVVFVVYSGYFRLYREIWTMPCQAGIGFYCNDSSLNSEGKLSFEFGQSFDQTFYNVSIACSQEREVPQLEEFANIQNLGHLNNSTVNSGEVISIKNLQCYELNNIKVTGAKGIEYNGFLWINYTSVDQGKKLGRFANVTIKIS
jgi:hypothetical protein